VAVAFILTPVLVLPTKVQAVSVVELQAQIEALLKQVAVLQQQLGGQSSDSEESIAFKCTIKKNWGFSPIENREVLILQNYLNRVYANTPGYTPIKLDKAIFDPSVVSALARYQSDNGINPASGYLGEITRAHINARLVTADCEHPVETEAPVIKGISGPTSIAVGKKGTWKIKATDSDNESLSYSINWGDEGICPTGKVCAQFIEPTDFVQTATFSHAYSQAGIYKIIARVTNSSGDTAEAGINVRVGEDNPIAGTPSIVDIDDDQIETSYNPAKPQIPFLDISFTAEIAAPENKDSYIWAEQPIALSLDRDGLPAAGSAKVMQGNHVSGDIETVTDSKGKKYYHLKAGETMSVRVETRYDTAVLFGGVYNGRVRGIYFDNNLKDQSGVSLVQSNIALGNKLAIVGERAPYISRVETPVSSNEEMTIFGERLDLELNQLYIDGKLLDGGRIQDNGTVWITAPLPNLRSGRHSLYIQHLSWGKSNTVYFTVNDGGNSSCTNVWGDANQDGRLTTADAVMANNIYTGTVRVTSCSYKAADVNNDGRVTPADAQLISDRLNVSVSVIDNVQIVGNQPQWFNQQTRKTITWNYNNVPLNKGNALRFKVGLYSDLNGGMWGNSTSVAVNSTAGTQSAVITAKVGRPWFNVKNYIRVRLVNADGTDYRPQGRRIEAISAQTFEVVADDSVTTYHPADINTDKRIVNSEMTDYCSKVGSTADCLIASEIWKRGEIYSYDKVVKVYLDASGKRIGVVSPH